MRGERILNTEECLICKAPLEYLLQDEEMECAVCHRREASKTRPSVIGGRPARPVV